MKIFYRLAFLVASLFLPLFAQNYVLYNQDNLLIPKSASFVQTLSSELYAKTGFSLYVVVVDKIKQEEREYRTTFKQGFIKDLKAPYGIVFFFKEGKKIDIFLEPSIEEINPNTIITQYMVPILMQEKSLTPSLISASILNGYAQLADEVASHYQASLEGNLIVDKSGVQKFVHYLLYVMLGTMLVLIVLFWRKK